MALTWASGVQAHVGIATVTVGNPGNAAELSETSARGGGPDRGLGSEE